MDGRGSGLLGFVAGVGCWALAGFMAPTSRPPRDGYVNVTRAINETRDGAKLLGELTALKSTGDAEIRAAREDAAKAKKAGDADADAKAAKAEALATQKQADLERRQKTGATQIMSGIGRILPTIRRARGLSAIHATSIPIGGSSLPLVYAVDDGLDVTDDLVKRYDAGEGDPPSPEAAKVTQLEKKVADLEAAKTGAKK